MAVAQRRGHVMTELTGDPRPSDRLVANMAKVDRSAVGNARAEADERGGRSRHHPDVRIGTDGVAYASRAFGNSLRSEASASFLCCRSSSISDFVSISEVEKEFGVLADEGAGVDVGDFTVGLVMSIPSNLQLMAELEKSPALGGATVRMPYATSWQ